MTIYLDNAATSWPKPPVMMEGMIDFNTRIGSNPGRSGHSLSIEAGRVLFEARDMLSCLFNIQDPMCVVLTSGITHSLNIVLRGLLKPGDHVITSSMEHNSVMRPLRELEQNGLSLSVIDCGDSGIIDPDRVRNAIRSNTVLIIITHASNVTGSIQPAGDIGRIAGEHGILFCLDSAQTAGALPVDVESMNIDLLCFSGHKSLLGPMGTGGLYIRKGLESRIKPLMQGGTGSRSEYELQPEFMPDRYESGTLNTLGIAGLVKSVEYILNEGVDKIRKREQVLVERLVSGLKGISGVTVYGPQPINLRTAAVPFNVAGINPSEAALYLDEMCGIMSRPGLHCAPSAHKTIGSFPGGTNRLSPGYFTTEDEIDAAVMAVHRLAALNK